MFIVKHYVIITEKFRFKKKINGAADFFMRQNAQEEILDLVYLAI